MIRSCQASDFAQIWEIILDGAQAYQGRIPADRLRQPYMTEQELRDEIEHGVGFCGYEQQGQLVAVMGVQPVREVTLIRHAYVRSTHQKQGIGGRLLSYLLESQPGPVLIGTWSDASWAIRFYLAYGFHLVPHEHKARLLQRYWTIPARQVETSVVLANPAALALLACA